jgi:hypothetical protein
MCCSTILRNDAEQSVTALSGSRDFGPEPDAKEGIQRPRGTELVLLGVAASGAESEAVSTGCAPM